MALLQSLANLGLILLGEVVVAIQDLKVDFTVRITLRIFQSVQDVRNDLGGDTSPTNES